MKITPHMLENVLCDAAERFVLCRETDSAHVELNASVLLINFFFFSSSS
jgi:hypothetical protein